MSTPEEGQPRESLLRRPARSHPDEKLSERQRKLEETTQALRAHMAKPFGLDASATTQQILDEVELWNSVTKKPAFQAYLEQRAIQQSTVIRKSLNTKLVWFTAATVVILGAAGLYLLGIPDFHQIRYGLAGALIGAAIQISKIVFDVMSDWVAAAKKANAEEKLPENLDTQEDLWRNMRDDELMLEKLELERQTLNINAYD
jgi:uncharacterized membrane protein